MSDPAALDEFQDQFDKVGLENLLLEIERSLTNGSDDKAELVQEYFRAIHSLKGVAATVNLSDIGHFLHAYEEAVGVLSKNMHSIVAVRNPEVFDYFLRGLDVVDQLIDFARNERGVLKDEPTLFNLYLQMTLDGRELAGKEDEYFELSALDESLF